MNKVYEKYKNSGVDWIGKIPLNWKSVNLKWISSITKGRKPKKDYEVVDDNLLPYLSMDFLRGKTSSPLYADKNERGIVLVDKGDLLILWDGSKAGEIVKAKKGVLSSTMAKIEINDDNFESNYLNYLLQLGEKHIQEHTIGMGIPHVSGDVLKNLLMLIPTLPEQTQIAKYLDYKTNLIDTIIAQKEELILKLKEQSQAIINEAVTKGINPDVKLKDSGIEWLGDIPEQWEVVKMKYLLSEKLKYGANESAIDSNPKHPRYIRITDFGSNGKLKSNTFKSLNPEVAEDYLLTEGDILFARSGATVGKTFQFKGYSGKACFAGYLIKASVSEKIYSDYLYFFTKSSLYENWKNSIFVQATIQNISAEKYNLLQITLPPKNEQLNIIKHLLERTKLIDKNHKLIKNSLKKLKEYRQSLISEAVTGKIDVRDWQAPKS